jgi:hypothetical protein
MVAPDTPRGTRRALLRAAAGAGAVGLAGCVISTEPHTETTERSFDPGDAEALVVRTHSGDVTLSAGDGGAVTGTVRKESRSGRDALDAVPVEGTVADGRLTVEPESPGDRDVSVSLDLRVPDGLAVVEAASANGDVEASGVAGDGTYRSSNGDVDVDGVDGHVALESTNGDLSADDTAGLDGATTTNGDVDVDVLGLRGDATCRSSNGDVTAAVPPDLTAAVSLETANGDAAVEGVSLTVESSSDRSVSGRLGAGDPEHTLALRSMNGDVTLLGL